MVNGPRPASPITSEQIKTIIETGVTTTGPLVPRIVTKSEIEAIRRGDVKLIISGGAASFGGGRPAPISTPVQTPAFEFEEPELEMVEEVPVPIPIEETVMPAGIQIGTRTSGGITFAVVSQPGGLPAKLIEQTTFLQQREADLARDLAVRQASFGQLQLEQASKAKVLEFKRIELERLSKSMVVPTPFFNKLLREFEALGGKFEVGSKLQERLASSFGAEQKKFEQTQAKLAGIAEAKRITGILQKRDVEGVPLEEQFGLEAAEATIISKKVLKPREFETPLAKEFFGLKQEAERLLEKSKFSAEGPLGFLGLSKAERESFPIIQEKIKLFESPTRQRVKLFVERAAKGDIFAAIEAGLTSGELTGRGFFTLGAAKEPTEVTEFKRQAQKTSVKLLGLQKTSVGQPEFSLFEGTKAERQEKFGFAGRQLTGLAALELGFGATDIGIKFLKSGKKFKDFDIGQAGAIGAGKKKVLKLPDVPTIKAGDIKGTFTIPKTFKQELAEAVRRGNLPDLSKFAERKVGTFKPAKTIAEELAEAVRRGNLPDLSKFAKKEVGTIKTLGAGEQKLAFTKLAKKGKVPAFDLRGLKVIEIPGKPELGGFVQLIKTKPVQSKIFKRTPFDFSHLKDLDTTAGLGTKSQLSFEKFAKEVTKAETILKLKPKPPSVIPGSAKALAIGLPKRPKGEFEELEFEAIRTKVGEIPDFKITQKTILGLKTKPILRLKTEPISITKQKESLGLISLPKESLILKSQIKELEKSLGKESEIVKDSLGLNLIPKSILRVSEVEQLKESEKINTSILSILKFPTITRQRILQRQLKITTPKLKERVSEEFTKPKQPRFKPPEFKEKAGITKKQLETFVQGFAIFERRREKFQRVGTGVFPKIAALAKAFKRAEETAAVTVKIVPTGAKVKPSKAVDIKEFFKLRSRFKLGKGGTFQELEKFRISTKGELAEITFAPRKAKAIKIKAIKALLPTFNKSKGGLSIL